MTQIEKFYTEPITVKRLNITGDKSTYGAVAGSLKCHVQQVTAEEANQVGGVFGKTWRMWCPVNADIKETDRLTIGGREYTIKGIDDNAQVSQAINKHLAVVIVEDLS